MHMVGHDMPFLDPALLLPGKPVKCLSKVPLDHPVELSSPVFRYEYDVVFALPFCMIEFLVVFHVSFGLWL